MNLSNRLLRPPWLVDLVRSPFVATLHSLHLFENIFLACLEFFEFSWIQCYMDCLLGPKICYSSKSEAVQSTPVQPNKRTKEEFRTSSGLCFVCFVRSWNCQAIFINTRNGKPVEGRISWMVNSLLWIIRTFLNHSFHILYSQTKD